MFKSSYSHGICRRSPLVPLPTARASHVLHHGHEENSTWSDLHWRRHHLHTLMTSSPTYIGDVIENLLHHRYEEDSTWSALHWWRYHLHALMTSPPTCIDDVITYIHWWHNETCYITDMMRIGRDITHFDDAFTSYIDDVKEKLLHHRYEVNSFKLMTSSATFIDDLITYM